MGATTQDTAAPVRSHDHVHGEAGHSHDHVRGEAGHSHHSDDHVNGGAEARRGQLGVGFPVLDIGDDIGALVLYATEDLEGQEIEVSLVGDPGHRTHTEVLKRRVDGRTFWAGVYVELPEGNYRVWYDDPSRETSFSITGGSVAELDWR